MPLALNKCGARHGHALTSIICQAYVVPKPDTDSPVAQVWTKRHATLYIALGKVIHRSNGLEVLFWRWGGAFAPRHDTQLLDMNATHVSVAQADPLPGLWLQRLANAPWASLHTCSCATARSARVRCGTAAAKPSQISLEFCLDSLQNRVPALPPQHPLSQPLDSYSVVQQQRQRQPRLPQPLPSLHCCVRCHHRRHRSCPHRGHPPGGCMAESPQA